MSNQKLFLAIIILGIFASTAFAQSNAPKAKKKKSNKITVIVGATNVLDYQDTFKLNKPESIIKEVKTARLQDSVTITVLLEGTTDGKKLVLSSNDPFDKYLKNGTLKYTEGWVNPSKEFSKSFTKSKGYKVEVRFKDRKEVFYGILEFNKVYEKCAGDPSARSYFIKIPELYIYNAMGGNISVVYEYYECIPREGDKTVRDYTTKKSRYTSWVLWLSDISFVE